VSELVQIDPRLRAAMREQLAHRRITLAAGADHIGWKLGVGERESIGGSIAVGYLTTATRLKANSEYVDDGLGADLHADVELAVRLGSDLDPRAGADAVIGAIDAYAVALEIVNLAPFLQAEAVVATNVFHRAVAFGPHQPPLLDRPAKTTARIKGQLHEDVVTDVDVGPRLIDATRILAAVEQRMRQGDWIITGSIIQIPVTTGSEIEAEIEPLGATRLTVVSERWA
jgi:2-keto-4-pentenoate hydratase